MDISRKAATSVPEEMQNWWAYKTILAEASILPDLWKGDDPQEQIRHFIDSETYGRIGLTNLPENRENLLQHLQSSGTRHHGTLPWVIKDLQEKLVRAMASSNWLLATRIAAAQAHYVADLHQPLHTTQNYDGSSGEGAGVHLRWEVQMPIYHWKVGYLQPRPVTYVSNLWEEVLSWTQEAHELFPPILKADERARATSRGNVESRLYYSILWGETKDIFIRQVNAAVSHLASLWYTAWIGAGRPAIPSPPEQLPSASIWLTLAEKEEPSPLPFFVGFAIVAIVIIWLCIRRQTAEKRPVITPSK